MPQYLVPSGRVLTTGDFLDAAVRAVMSPGVVTISEDASIEAAYNSLVAHQIHAVLVIGAANGTPLGWATASGMLAYADKDRDLISAKDAIVEAPRAVKMRATVREAISELSRADTTHLLVVDEIGKFPIGTISDLDLAAFLGHRSG